MKATDPKDLRAWFSELEAWYVDNDNGWKMSNWPWYRCEECDAKAPAILLVADEVDRVGLDSTALRELVDPCDLELPMVSGIRKAIIVLDRLSAVRASKPRKARSTEPTTLGRDLAWLDEFRLTCESMGHGAIAHFASLKSVSRERMSKALQRAREHESRMKKPPRKKRESSKRK